VIVDSGHNLVPELLSEENDKVSEWCYISTLAIISETPDYEPTNDELKVAHELMKAVFDSEDPLYDLKQIRLEESRELLRTEYVYLKAIADLDFKSFKSEVLKTIPRDIYTSIVKDSLDGIEPRSADATTVLYLLYHLLVVHVLVDTAYFAGK
jgi:hypothetical protein